jgi:hypothetical protein
LDRRTVDYDGRTYPLTLRRNPRARRMILRLDKGEDGAVVTVPRGVAIADALAFAAAKRAWIARRLDAVPARVPFVDGAKVPLQGRNRTIRHEGSGKGAVRGAGDEIWVRGAPARVPALVTMWLKCEARRAILARVEPACRRLGKPAGRVVLRDPRTRWGSCAASGNLSFSWRLIMAPAFVLDYVVAHEVTHLAQANHGAGFWRLVETLCDDVGKARDWLRVQGRSLHRFG